MLGKASEDGEQVSVKEAIGYSAVAVALCFALAYPGASFIRELIGQKGLALSPVIALLVVWPVAAVLMYAEAWVQSQSWWNGFKKVWSWGLGILLCGVPLVTALTIPCPVGEGWPGGLPTVVAACPIVVLFAFLVARRRWRERKRG
ncbi:hypothetical protein ADK70_04725 [Streptomyces rimosus subsp. pseudoverticillatus]|uniref:hypothetical protein n=1 Tax=Streptomyces rimosus TaxID=1927 RepID=UPI0006B2A5C7|nr:hypothetical protein [Streptomyces rimosus]KOT99147.1 hypothetical protein ADK70_04725 [Streptomyces rimosus subsp. pseudoverticillatus]